MHLELSRVGVILACKGGVHHKPLLTLALPAILSAWSFCLDSRTPRTVDPQQSFKNDVEPSHISQGFSLHFFLVVVVFVCVCVCAFFVFFFWGEGLVTVSLNPWELASGLAVTYHRAIQRRASECLCFHCRARHCDVTDRNASVEVRIFQRNPTLIGLWWPSHLCTVQDLVVCCCHEWEARPPRLRSCSRLLLTWGSKDRLPN